MKIKIILAITTFSGFCLQAQVGIETQFPNASSNLTVSEKSSTGSFKGTLLGNMTTDNINTISNPAKGLVVYNYVKKCLSVNLGSPSDPNWKCIKTKE